jgi:hypothetical protein
LTFEGKILEANDVVYEEFEIKNREFAKLKWNIECNFYNQPFVLTFTPSSGKLSAVRGRCMSY